jgi:hypothetical protein
MQLRALHWHRMADQRNNPMHAQRPYHSSFTCQYGCLYSHFPHPRTTPPHPYPHTLTLYWRRNVSRGTNSARLTHWGTASRPCSASLTSTSRSAAEPEPSAADSLAAACGEHKHEAKWCQGSGGTGAIMFEQRWP